MKALVTLFAASLLAAAIALPAGAANITALETLMDSAKVMETHIFAPKAWEKAEKEFAEAQKAVQQQKNEKTIVKHATRAQEYTENAIKATEVCKLSLSEYLEPRDKAKKARAPMYVPELYAEAEEQFMKATKKVEEGSVKDGLKEAQKSSPFFDQAELEAIRVDLLGTADQLLAKAQADEAEKYALATFDRARTARKKANAILTSDRYERSESLLEIVRAEYEARHASNIAMSVRSLERNDQAWEKLMLIYEIQMNRVGAAIGLEHLPFDNGPLAAADTLISYIQHGQKDRQRLTQESRGLTTDLGEQLRFSLARVGETGGVADPVELARLVDEQLALLLMQRDDLASQVEQSETQLAQISRDHEVMSEELSLRLEREKKFRKAKQMIPPSEGEVLFNASNDVVLRLSGLAFAPGSADLKDDQTELLEKVVEIIGMFPGSELMVEGHTDAQGDPGANLQLSEKRAYAVMMYLRERLLIPADRIRSIGYGAERPIASNQTSKGRAKNRRNDVIIMQ